MIENSQVMIRIEYVRGGIRRVSCGEIDKNKLDEVKLDGLHSGDESYILLTNDGKVAWVDKEAILSFSELETKSCVYEKEEAENGSFAVKKELRITS